MKYRILTKEELTHFDEDFKHFLISNGISNEDWLKWNKNHDTKATELVQLFSDIVLQKVYEKIEFLEHRNQSSCIIFHMKKDNIDLISLNAKTETTNLSTIESIHYNLVNKPENINYFKTSKSYTKTRELEIHELIESGCVLSSKDFWEELMKI